MAGYKPIWPWIANQPRIILRLTIHICLAQQCAAVWVSLAVCNAHKISGVHMGTRPARKAASWWRPRWRKKHRITGLSKVSVDDNDDDDEDDSTDSPTSSLMWHGLWGRVLLHSYPLYNRSKRTASLQIILLSYPSCQDEVSINKYLAGCSIPFSTACSSLSIIVEIKHFTSK